MLADSIKRKQSQLKERSSFFRELYQFEEALEVQVINKVILGAVLLVTRDDRILLSSTVGQMRPDTNREMPIDAIFPIFSMTKALTAAAALRLFERGLLDLTHSVSRYIPEMADLLVLNPNKDSHQRFVKIDRQITIHDLLMHTAGIAGGGHSAPVIEELYRAAGVISFKHESASMPSDASDFVRKLAQLPLAHQPGTAWEYSRSYDVLGRILEIICGQRLDAILATEVLDRLAMIDTGFVLKENQSSRITAPYNKRDVESYVSDLRMPRPMISGGSGALSTAFDYTRFCQMILQGGKIDGEPFLQPSSINLMMHNQLGSLVGSGPDYIPGRGWGYAYGFAVREERGENPQAIWLGRGGTVCAIDAKSKTAIVLMMQKGRVRGRHYLYVLQRMLRHLDCPYN